MDEVSDVTGTRMTAAEFAQLPEITEPHDPREYWIVKPATDSVEVWGA